jgi:hypothetical protein
MAEPRDARADDLEVVDLVDVVDAARDVPARPGPGPAEGHDRAARRAPVLLGAVALLLVVAIVAAVVDSASDDATAPTTPTTAPPRLAVPPLDLTDGDGALFSVPTSASVITGGAHGLRRVDLATGAVHVVPTRGLPDGRVDVLVQRGDLLAVRVGAEISIIDVRRGSAERVPGRSAFSAVASTAIWVADGDRATRYTSFGAGSPLRGTASPVARAVGGAVAETEAGLVVLDGEGLWVVAPGGRRQVLARGATRLVAADGVRVAWTDRGCGADRCPVHVTDVVAGGESVIALPGQARPCLTVGRFSPDGARLALRHEGGLVIGDLHDGAAVPILGAELMPLPGFECRLGLAPRSAFGWSGDGRLLLFAVVGTRGEGSLGLVDVAARRVELSWPLLESATSLAVLPDVGWPLRTDLHVARLDGNRLDVLRVDGGGVEAFPLLGDDLGDEPGGAQVVRRGGGLYARLADGALWWVDDDRRVAPVRLGSADSLLRGRNGLTVVVTDGSRVREYREGTLARDVVELEPGTRVAGAVGAGWVVVDGGGIAVLEPDTGRRTVVTAERDVQVLDAAGDSIVWVSCEGRTDCTLRHTDAATMATRDLAAADRHDVVGVLSPDGRFLVRRERTVLVLEDLARDWYLPLSAEPLAHVRAVTDDQWVAWDAVGGLWLWQPGLAPFRVGGGVLPGALALY